MERTADFDQELGSRLRRCRRAKGVTQAELARSLGVARTSITNIEAGRQPLSAWLLWRIARLLDAEIRQLLPDPVESASDTARELPSDLTPRSRELIRRLTATS